LSARIATMTSPSRSTATAETAQPLAAQLSIAVYTMVLAIA